MKKLSFTLLLIITLFTGKNSFAQSNYNSCIVYQCTSNIPFTFAPDLHCCIQITLHQTVTCPNLVDSGGQPTVTNLTTTSRFCPDGQNTFCYYAQNCECDDQCILSMGSIDITVFPSSGSAGTTVTLTGTDAYNFYTAISRLNLSSVYYGHAQMTDCNGDLFIFDIIARGDGLQIGH